jgi:hypothetical protein
MSRQAANNVAVKNEGMIFITEPDASFTTDSGGEEFLDGFFDGFAGFARALLDPANQFVRFALGELEIVIRERAPFLLQFALADVPVAFDFEYSHDFIFVCFIAVNAMTK